MGLTVPTAVFADRAVHNGYQTLALSLFRRSAFLLGRTFFRYVRAVRSFVGLNVLESTFRVPHCIEFGARDTAMRSAFARHVSSHFSRPKYASRLEELMWALQANRRFRPIADTPRQGEPVECGHQTACLSVFSRA